MTTNASSKLCARCQSIFQAQQEPDFLTEQSIPTINTTLAHHKDEASFQEAIRSGCFICQSMKTEYEPRYDQGQTGPVTRAQLFKTSEGEYNVAIYLIEGPGQQIGRVTYFVVTQVSGSAILSVPVDQHEDLIRRWVSTCRSGSGSHAACHHSREARRKLLNLPQLRHVLQLRNETQSGEAFVRLQDIEAVEPLTFPYATVTHQHGSSQQQPLSSDNSEYGLETWQTEMSLPLWLRQVVKAAVASGVFHLWEPTLCSKPDGIEDTAEIYAGASLNIVHVSGQLAHERSYQGAIPIIGPSWAPQHRLAVYQRTMFRNAIVDSPEWTTSSFQQALLLAPTTLFVVGDENEHQHLWWHCADGALYGDAVADGVTIGDSVADEDDSAVPQMRLAGTHSLDQQHLLAQVLHPETATTTSYVSHAERLAALWTSFATPYSHTEANEKVLQDTANVIRQLVFGNNEEMRVALATYAHGTWLGDLVYQLAWHSDSLSQEELPRNRRDALPSWSWLSFHGPIIFEFLLASNNAGLMAPCLDPKRPHIKPCATAAFDPDDQSNIKASGRLLEVSMDTYHETGSLQLLGDGGQAMVHLDCEEEDDMILKSKGLGLGREQTGNYVAWPIFAQIDEAGRVEARGLVLREVRSQEIPAFVRCGWFQFSSADQAAGFEASECMLKLARGDLSMHKGFLIV